MKVVKLQPNQIMTRNDFPLHNEQILKIYFRVCQKGHPEILPPVPVMHKSTGLPLLRGKDKSVKKYNEAIKNYFEDNPKVEYILTDGGHKTTAACLTRTPIYAVVLKTDKDVQKLKSLIKNGEYFNWATGNTIRTILREKAGHFFEAEFFQTVEDKTKRMVQAKVIPKYMIDYYKKRIR